MAKPRFVIDTNVLVSGILIFQSSSDKAYKKARSMGKILFSESSFQELAINGNADFIITGDQDLLVLNPFRGIQIITVNEFLKLD